MGSLREKEDDQGRPRLISLPQDLKVTVHRSCLVFPSQETEKKTLFLSNIDQVLNFDVQTVHFFGSHKDFTDSQIVAEKLKETLAKILVPYDFLAGRLKLNPNTGRLEIDCNAAGAGFVVASSEYALDEIGDFVYPNSAFAQLVCSAMDPHILKPAAGRDDHDLDQPLCILQVTTFKCGGFAMGISNNHATFDGLSFRLFLHNLASLAANKPLAVIPYNERHVLAARSPPDVKFFHPELLELKNISTLEREREHEHENDKDEVGGQDTNPTVFEATQEELDFKIFRLTASDVTHLKEKAKSTSSSSSTTRGLITSFNVVTALIWRCKALSSSSSSPSCDAESRILYAVDIRPKLKPALPKEYTGNAVLTAYASAKRRELEEGPFSRMVEMVSEGATRMTDEYARSVIDWGELHKGFPQGEVLVSSWWRLGFADVDYPWGKPRYSCPVVYHRKDIILLFPEQHDNSSSSSTTTAGQNATGVNILVALPHKEMQKFQALFQSFLLD